MARLHPTRLAPARTATIAHAPRDHTLSAGPSRGAGAASTWSRNRRPLAVAAPCASAQQPGAHAGPHVRGPKWLREVVGDASRESGRRAIGARLTGDEHDRYRAQIGVGLLA